jgi:hypothetical protein
VGAVFYAYVDDPVGGGGGMMHNENSNYGLVDSHDRPYAPCTRQVASANGRVYAWRRATAVPEPTITIATPRDFHREPVDRFFVQRNGRVIGDRYVRAFLRGREAGEDTQSAVFEMDFDRLSRFAACVYEVEKDAVLEFLLDGKRKATIPLRAGPGHGLFSIRMPEGMHSVYDREFGVTVPAGRHAVTVRNAGRGWIWLDAYRVRPAVRRR